MMRKLLLAGCLFLAACTHVQTPTLVRPTFGVALSPAPSYFPNGAVTGGAVGVYTAAPGAALDVEAPTATITPANPGTAAGAALTVVGQAGGAALSGNNTGGAGAAISITSGAGGASTGNAANSSGGDITIAGGAAGTGGSGAAGLSGRFILGALSGSAFLDAHTAAMLNPGNPSGIWNVFAEDKPSTTAAFADDIALQGEVDGPSADARNSGTYTGISGVVEYAGSGTGTSIYGVSGTANGFSTVNANVNVATKVAFNAEVQSSGGTVGGTTTNAYAFRADETAAFSAATTTTNYYGLYLTEPTTVGSVVNQTGVYIGPWVDGSGTNDAFLYNGSSPVVVPGAGGVGIGTTTGVIAGTARALDGLQVVPAALATFGSCDAAHEGMMATQTNSTAACSAGTNATSAGNVHCQIYCNGSNWKQTGL